MTGAARGVRAIGAPGPGPGADVLAVNDGLQTGAQHIERMGLGVVQALQLKIRGVEGLQEGCLPGQRINAYEARGPQGKTAMARWAVLPRCNARTLALWCVRHAVHAMGVRGSGAARQRLPCPVGCADRIQTALWRMTLIQTDSQAPTGSFLVQSLPCACIRVKTRSGGVWQIALQLAVANCTALHFCQVLRQLPSW